MDPLATPLPLVLDGLGISDWDVLMIGDGSGSGWNIGIGWAVTVIERARNGRKLLWGSWSSGTVVIAELMAYVHGLAWYEHNMAGAARALLRKQVLNLHVITDSETVVHQGNNVVGRQKMLPWWACFGNFLRLGYTAKFHHVPGHDRERVLGLNVLTDHLSRAARVANSEIDTTRVVPGHAPTDPYEVNPNLGDGLC